MVNNLINQVRRLKYTRFATEKCRPAAAIVAPAAYFRKKHFLDYCLAVLLLMPCLPLMAILMLLVKLTSRGPAIYRQCRAGRKGAPFYMLKIRTMTHDAESRTGPAWTQIADPRVTPVGHFLRKFHLDELPQLFNVLKGEMSLVGPRPERPEFVAVLARQIPDYLNRLAVLPGITGLAQLNLPPDSDLDSVRRKIALDIEYIETANLWMDWKLLCCTGMRIFKLPVLRMFGVLRQVELPAPTIDKYRGVGPQSTVETVHSHGNGDSNGAGETVVTLQQIQEQAEARSAGASHHKSFRRGR
jgi:lipopolysaccharide/colanic/teichoic acid biosynthesis glycosyltransferase